jgi:ferredoxin
VHMWGLPPRVEHFVRRLGPRGLDYVFAAAVNAGQVVRSLVHLDRILRRSGSSLGAGFSLVMPGNYTPFGGPGSAEEQEQLFSFARVRVREVGEVLRARRHAPAEKSSWWENLLFTPLNRLVSPLAARMDRFFRADDSCTGCGTCERVCPAGNIRLQAGRPLWQHRCEQCWACFHWCPEQAIQYGARTVGRRRYQHPQVSLEELIASNNASPPV